VEAERGIRTSPFFHSPKLPDRIRFILFMERK